MPIYSIIENRIKQLYGFCEVINNLDICANNFPLKVLMTDKVINKTVFLTYLSSNFYYKKEDANIFQFFCDVYIESSKVLDDLYLTSNNTKNIKDHKKVLGKAIQYYLKKL